MPTGGPSRALRLHRSFACAVDLMFSPRWQQTCRHRLVSRPSVCAGSGKSSIARRIREAEVAAGGEAPRIHSIDEYFMQVRLVCWSFLHPWHPSSLTPCMIPSLAPTAYAQCIAGVDVRMMNGPGSAAVLRFMHMRPKGHIVTGASRCNQMVQGSIECIMPYLVGHNPKMWESL